MNRPIPIFLAPMKRWAARATGDAAQGAHRRGDLQNDFLRRHARQRMPTGANPGRGEPQSHSRRFDEQACSIGFRLRAALTHRLARHAAEGPPRASRRGSRSRLPRRRASRSIPFYRPLASDADLFRRLRLAIYVNDAGEFAAREMIRTPRRRRAAIFACFLAACPRREWLTGRARRSARAGCERAFALSRSRSHSHDLAGASRFLRGGAPSMEATAFVRRAILAGLSTTQSFAEALAPREPYPAAPARRSLFQRDNARPRCFRER